MFNKRKWFYFEEIFLAKKMETLVAENMIPFEEIIKKYGQ
jgi:hypothetical protein